MEEAGLGPDLVWVPFNQLLIALAMTPWALDCCPCALAWRPCLSSSEGEGGRELGLWFSFGSRRLGSFTCPWPGWTAAARNGEGSGNALLCAVIDHANGWHQFNQWNYLNQLAGWGEAPTCKMHVRSNRKALINSSQTVFSCLGQLLPGSIRVPDARARTGTTLGISNRGLVQNKGSEAVRRELFREHKWVSMYLLSSTTDKTLWEQSSL